MTFTLAHLSDAHLGPLPKPRRRDLLGKRVTGYLNWTRSRHKFHNMAVLKAIVDDILEQKPDHIAVTGDLTNIGLSGEFMLAKSWLETLGEPHAVSFVPGNHDAYTWASVANLTQVFAPWVSAGRPQAAQYPYLRQRGKIALIGLSSAVPTLPFIASGRLGAAQLTMLRRLLQEAGKQGLARVVMLHHPPLSRGSRFVRGLQDSSEFKALLSEYGAELVIHGHNHRLSVKYLNGPQGPIPVVGVPSASSIRSAGYHLFKISEESKGFKIEAFARGLQRPAMKIGDLGAISL